MIKPKPYGFRRFKSIISTPLEDNIFDELKDLAKKEDIAVTVLVRRAINRFLNKDENEL